MRGEPFSTICKLVDETLKFNDALAPYRGRLRRKFLGPCLGNTRVTIIASRAVYSCIKKATCGFLVAPLECTRPEEESHGVHFARALVAVKSHCFRYCEYERTDAARRAGNTIARIARHAYNAYMHIRICIYTKCYARIPYMGSIYTIHVMYCVSCYAARCVYLHSLLFRIPLCSLLSILLFASYINTNTHTYRRISLRSLHFINGFW